MIPESFLSCHQKKLLAVRRKQLSPELEQSLYDRSIQIAMDGSILMDGDDVYVLNASFDARVDRIEYFHGLVLGMPAASLYSDDATIAINMIPLGLRGNTAKRISLLQRKWRNQRWRLYVQFDLIQLAKEMLALIKEGRKLGWIVPSLDYDKKIAERQYKKTKSDVAKIIILEKLPLLNDNDLRIIMKACAKRL